MKTPPKLVGTKTHNWANLKYKIASQVFFPCIINFHKTGTVHLGRNPFSSYFNQVSNLISMSNVKSNFEKFAILTLDVGREAKNPYLWKHKIWKKSFAFLPWFGYAWGSVTRLKVCMPYYSFFLSKVLKFQKCRHLAFGICKNKSKH